MAFLAPIAAIASIGSTIAGGFMQAKGAQQTANAQNQMYQYQAGIAEQNAAISRQNSGYALIQGEDSAAQAGQAGVQRLGAIQAAQGASGFQVNSGTNRQVQQSQKLVTQNNEEIIRSNAAKTAYDYNVQATQYDNQATLDIMAGQNAKAAGQINVDSAILGTVGSVASKWMQGNQSGSFGASSATDALSQAFS